VRRSLKSAALRDFDVTLKPKHKQQVGGLELGKVKFRKFHVEKWHVITISVVLILADFLRFYFCRQTSFKNLSWKRTKLKEVLNKKGGGKDWFLVRVEGKQKFKTKSQKERN